MKTVICRIFSRNANSHIQLKCGLTLKISLKSVMTLRYDFFMVSILRLMSTDMIIDHNGHVLKVIPTLSWRIQERDGSRILTDELRCPYVKIMIKYKQML